MAPGVNTRNLDVDIYISLGVDIAIPGADIRVLGQASHVRRLESGLERS